MLFREASSQAVREARSVGMLLCSCVLCGWLMVMVGAPVNEMILTGRFGRNVFRFFG